jgi:hypothetical protein
MTQPTPPEVRQCRDTSDVNFGCVAVATPHPNFAWGVFNPATGGHWESNDETVKTWKVVT